MDIAAVPLPLHRIPLTIIGGFLGAGKTTLLNHLLTHSEGRRFAVIVNDFGAINIDSRLIVSVEGETISLANGCICCVIRDDLVEAVLRLCRSDTPPDHIVVETSGVSRPVSVVESFFRPEVQQWVEVQNMIALLDAEQAAADPGLGEAATYADLAYAQVAVADMVVINKIDLVPPAVRKLVRARVEAIVPRARILEASFGRVPIDLLFDHELSMAVALLKDRAGNDGLVGLSRDDFDAGRGVLRVHDGLFGAWSYQDTDRTFSFDMVQRIVEGLPRGIYRAKGTVRLALPTGEQGLLQVVGRRGRLKLTPPTTGPVPATALIFIGAPDATDDQELRTHIDHCWQSAADPLASRIVTDLRAFNVEFI